MQVNPQQDSRSAFYRSLQCFLYIIISPQHHYILQIIENLASLNTKLQFPNLVWLLISAWVPFHMMQPGNSRNKLGQNRAYLPYFLFNRVSDHCPVLTLPRVWKPLFHIFCPIFCLLWQEDKIWSLLLHHSWKLNLLHSVLKNFLKLNSLRRHKLSSFTPKPLTTKYSFRMNSFTHIYATCLVSKFGWVCNWFLVSPFQSAFSS